MKRIVRREKSEIERTYRESESESEIWSFGFAKKRR